MDFPTQCVVLVNRLVPQTSLEGYRNPLTASKARAVCEGWVRDGIPENVCLRAITAVCGRIPKGTHISSLRYFDKAVRDAHQNGIEPTLDELRERGKKAMQEALK